MLDKDGCLVLSSPIEDNFVDNKSSQPVNLAVVDASFFTGLWTAAVSPPLCVRLVNMLLLFIVVVLIRGIVVMTDETDLDHHKEDAQDLHRPGVALGLLRERAGVEVPRESPDLLLVIASLSHLFLWIRKKYAS